MSDKARGGKRPIIGWLGKLRRRMQKSGAWLFRRGKKRRKIAEASRRRNRR